METTGSSKNSLTDALRRAPQGRTSLRRRLLGGLSGAVILAATTLPMTIDQTSLLPELQTAQAASEAAGGNESGTGEGRGIGKGNGKGQGGGNNGNGGGMGDDDEGHDSGGGGGGGGGNATGPSGDGGGHDFGGSDDTGGAGPAVGAIEDSPPGAPVSAQAAGLPTIQQIFAMDDKSVLSADQELSAIENGWGTPPGE